MRSGGLQAWNESNEAVAMLLPGNPVTGVPLDVFPESYTNRDKGIVIAICERYGLDLLGREVEILHGIPYITAKGINRIALNDPAFDGVEVDIIEADFRRNRFMIKARAWCKGCQHPVEEFADSDGSSLRGGNLFRHTITRAKARALRSAFAIPYCAKEELSDHILVPAIQPTPPVQTKSHPTTGPTKLRPVPSPDPDKSKPDPRPPPTTTRALTEKDHDDKGYHPGERWKKANARLRAIASANNVTNDQIRTCIAHLLKRDSSKKLTAQQLHELADWLDKEAHPGDLDYKAHVQNQMLDVCSSAPTSEEIADLLDLAKNPWQVVFHQQVLAKCSSGGDT